MGSPPHSHSSVGRHSRESSSSRFSGSLKPGSHKISPNDASTGGLKGQKQWKECDAIEEGLLDDEERRKGLPRKCYFLAFSVTFEQFRIQAGSDSTGVATDMISVNSTVRMTYRNKGTFFGVHVTSTPMDLSYSEITLVPGSIKKFYQSRKSQRSWFEWFDDDGRPKRTGTVWTASAHIITAVIGSGVLSLAWAIGQLGWITGQL
uniref:Amino acid permease 4 n=1 Tax=Populus alba TaxID=43335 RepID=A0A4U5NQR5_POPAL|nr:Amino acid permease 4 [Populus alba]